MFTTFAALVAGEPRPSVAAVAALVACGATGYGLSLRFYLLTQRRVGAGRTGSVFALAPFVGAALAFLLGDRAAGPWTAIAAALFGAGLWLHVSERHGHRHRHEAIDHDHAHRHDDGHHTPRMSSRSRVSTHIRTITTRPSTTTRRARHHNGHRH